MSQPIIINEIENRLKLSGGTLTGSLSINNGYAYAAGNADESIFLSRRNSNDEKYSRYISISSKESIAIDSSINFVERNNNVWKTYKLYGEHNKPTPGEIGAPSLIGEGASGDWNINITGNSNSANRIERQDTRSVNEAPIDMLAGLSIHLKGSNDGLDDGGTYHAAIHIKDWQDYSGGPFGQMAITGNSNFWFRVSTSGTAWGAWKKVLDSSNYTSYTVTKTGSGASGTWGISISGNAATATSATKATQDGNGATIASTYLKLSGGTMTGNITRNQVGQSWIDVTHGRACAIKLSAAASGGSASCLWSVKTNAGAWGCGGLSGKDNMYFSYGTDTNYNAGTNTLSGQIIFTSSGGIVVASNTEYTTYKARNIAANTSLSKPADGNIFLVYT